MSRGRLAKVARFARAQQRGAERIYGEVGAREWAAAAGLWSASAAWCLPLMSTATLLSDRLGLPPERLRRLYEVFVAGELRLLGVRWRAEVDKGLDPRASYVFLQNHVNHFDFIALHNAVPHYLQGVELEEHFRYPLYGPFMRARGTVPVKRAERGQTGALTDAIGAELARGRSLLGFPEGTRTLDGRVGVFREGLFHIARELGAPVVPVAAVGMGDLMRKGTILLRPRARITVHVGPPEPTASLGPADIPALAARVQRWIASRTDPV